MKPVRSLAMCLLSLTLLACVAVWGATIALVSASAELTRRVDTANDPSQGELVIARLSQWLRGTLTDDQVLPGATWVVILFLPPTYLSIRWLRRLRANPSESA